MTPMSSRPSPGVCCQAGTTGLAVSRRVLLAGIVASGAAAALGVGRRAGAAEPPAPPPAEGVHVQVVAHQDDDLLFMSADLAAGIEAGRPMATVYLTAGEGSVDPGPYADGGTVPDPVGFDRESYAASRQAGARAAWAQLAGVPDSWSREALTIGSGSAARVVELDVLDGREVYLVFVGLPDWADAHPDTRPLPGDPTALGASVQHMWLDGSTRRTVLATGSPVTVRQDYARDDLLRVLAGVYELAGLTVLRVQDPYPDLRYWDNPGWFHDHSDHVMTARIALAALSVAGQERPDVQAVSYRCYNSAVSPANLDPDRVQEARDVFAAYAAHDVAVDNLGGYVEWPRRVHRRWWAGTDWVGRNEDGRLQAFAVRSGRLVTWWQTASGDWAGPDGLGGPGSDLAPGVSAVRDGQGRMLVLALRADTAEIVQVAQEFPNGAWLPGRTTLGVPPGGSAAAVGQPAALTWPDGRVQVFARDGYGGVSTALQPAPGAGFGAWQRLGADTAIQDGLAVRCRLDGTADLFGVATTEAGSEIAHWVGTGPGAGFVRDPSFECPEPASPPTLTAHEDGRLSLLFRTSDGRSGALGAWVGHVWQRSDGSWATPGEAFPAHGGTGPVAAAAAPVARDGVVQPDDSRILVLTHNRRGGVSTTSQDAPNGGFLWDWQDTGSFSAGTPCAAADGEGRIQLLAVDGLGRLLVNGQTAAGGAAPLAGWRVAAP